MKREADTVYVSVWRSDGHFSRAGSSELDQGTAAPADERPEKRRIVEEALRGDESVAAVARRHGINANLLFNWRKLYRQGLLEQCREPASTRLLPVSVTPSVPTVSDRRGAAGSITVELPGEICVRLEGRVDPDALAEVLVVLGVR